MEVRKIYRQTIRTFYEVKNGAVRILHTDPVLHPKVGKDAKEGAERKSRHKQGIHATSTTSVS